MSSLFHSWQNGRKLASHECFLSSCTLTVSNIKFWVLRCLLDRQPFKTLKDITATQQKYLQRFQCNLKVVTTGKVAGEPHKSIFDVILSFEYVGEMIYWFFVVKKGDFNRFPAPELKDPEVWPCRTMTDDHLNYPNITAQL